MKFANLVLASALLVGSAVVVAVAQPAPPAGGAPGAGRGAALQAACGADVTANCADAGRGVRQCLTDNTAKLSAGCKAYLAANPGRGPGGAPPAGAAAP